MCAVLEIFAESLKLHQGVAPVWKAKCKDLHGKMKDSRCVVLEIFVKSLKLHQGVAPVWKAKCKDLHGNKNDFRCVRRQDFRGIADIAPRVGPSVESKM